MRNEDRDSIGELQLRTDQELIDELSRRCRSIVIARVKDISDEEFVPLYCYSGGFESAIGLCTMLMNALTDALRNVEESGDEDPQEG